MPAMPNNPLCRFVLAHSKNNYTRTFQEHDVVYLFNKLLAVQAFEVIPTHDTIMWGNKFVPKERFGIIPIYVSYYIFIKLVYLRVLCSANSALSLCRVIVS